MRVSLYEMNAVNLNSDARVCEGELEDADAYATN